jgi:hypothetical protein
VLVDRDEPVFRLRKAALRFGGSGKELCAHAQDVLMNLELRSAGGDGEIGVRLGVEESVKAVSIVYREPVIVLTLRT